MEDQRCVLCFLRSDRRTYWSRDTLSQSLIMLLREAHHGWQISAGSSPWPGRKTQVLLRGGRDRRGEINERAQLGLKDFLNRSTG
ncbi:hypothetical protein E2C01_079135 [Portunus trituberculatus]|uniref:Uncharacterized protein n=1 Tax=Portunus trituberculatus TaxID=210409 RepID=A0A5B7ISH4_PORTR|nr:hypothetical protein [Portunus trituberculatus]